MTFLQSFIVDSSRSAERPNTIFCKIVVVRAKVILAVKDCNLENFRARTDLMTNNLKEVSQIGPDRKTHLT